MSFYFGLGRNIPDARANRPVNPCGFARCLPPDGFCRKSLAIVDTILYKDAHTVGVAQSVEHRVVAPVVEGSIPFTHPILPASRARSSAG